MKNAVLALVTCALVGCGMPKEGQQAIDSMKGFGNTASGAYHEAKGQVEGAIEMGKSVTDDMNNMVDDAQRRMQQIQDGMNKMMEGKEMIQQGVQGE